VVSGATFSGNALFTLATFVTGQFDEVTFSRDAWFDATFYFANFKRATFHRNAGFDDATFSDADFSDATFSFNALFERATFGAAGFAGATFIGEGRFGSSHFNGFASFDAIESKAAFSLADATFRQVPSLLGATFRGTLRLDNVQTPRFRLLGWTHDKDAPARFRELKRRAHEAQDRDRELEFFAQEIRTSRFLRVRVPFLSAYLRRRLPVPRFWQWRFWFGLLYGTFSDFGRSFLRPVVFWTVLFAITAILYLGENEGMKQSRAARNPHHIWETVVGYAVTTRHALANSPACVPKGESNANEFAATNAVNEALYLALKNGLFGFDVGRSDTARRIYGCLYGLASDVAQSPIVPYRVSLVSTAQTLASGVLILLFFLAVRNFLRLN
jgi:hypothetical protein